jgi:YHS domain-containing protein
MKSKLLAITMLAAFPIACSAPSSDEASEATEQAGDGLAEVADAMTGPVFTGPAGSPNVAVSGYDAVSYFQGDGVPVEGSDAHGVTYNGVEYHFSSAENATAFEAEPGKYAPAYGGHCAWAMSRGSLAPGDPSRYRIVDGKLYLNFSEEVQKTWLADIPGFLEKSEKAWPEVPADARFDDQ